MATSKTKPDQRRLKRLDLDAAAREAGTPDGILLVLKGVEYELPAELPIDVFDPFLSDDFDLVALIRAYYDAGERAGEDASGLGVVLSLLEDRPLLHRQTIAAVSAALRSLFGEEQYATFLAGRPSIEDFSRVGSHLVDEYGVSLGELFASPTTSTTGGATQKQTSEPTTESTSDTPGSGETTDG